jgi:hypothetical protein
MVDIMPRELTNSGWLLKSYLSSKTSKAALKAPHLWDNHIQGIICSNLGFMMYEQCFYYK